MTDAEYVAGLLDPAPGDLERLRGRLADAAARNGLLDVAVDTVDSPLGRLLLAATPAGLVRVAYEREGFDAVLERLALTVSPRVLRAPGRLAGVARELDEYFAGRRRAFDVPLDRSLSHGFRGRVQSLLPDIPFGATRTYRQIALLAGNPAAVRAVGSACSTNPLPIVVPCHRVLRTDGSLGGYVGGLAAKSALIALEAA